MASEELVGTAAILLAESVRQAPSLALSDKLGNESPLQRYGIASYVTVNRVHEGAESIRW